MNLTHQDDIIFATLFTYPQGGGDGVWFVASSMVKLADGSFSGDLYKTAGSAFNANPVVPTTGAQVTKVGTMTFKPSDGQNGMLTYTVDGIGVSKAITRQVFGASQSTCAKG